jgi:hypothetical protein
VFDPIGTATKCYGPRSERFGVNNPFGFKRKPNPAELMLTPTSKGNMLSPAMQRQWPGSQAMAALLPTPSRTSYGSTNNGCPHDGRTEYATRGTPSLETMVRRGMLPTPTAADVKGPNPLDRRPVCDDDLPTRVLRMGLLPSPSARDWKSSAASPETLERNSRPLNETARASGIAGTAASLLVLVEWMMGYPAGWLARALPPSAMPSSRKSPKP